MKQLLTMLTLVFLLGAMSRAAADDSPNAKAVRELVKKTGEGSYAEGVPEVLEIRLGQETTDAHLKALANLAPPKLWKLNLATASSLDANGKEQTKFTRAGWKELSRLPALRELSVPHACGDDDLKEVAGCKKLETLSLIFSGVTDAGLAHLATAPKLREIHLGRSKTTDAGWEPLSKVATLEKITPCEQVTGKGIEKLAGLKKLTELDLRFCAITDAALTDIAKLKTLKALDLGTTKITDDGVKSLAGLTGLANLNLSDTKCTPAGVVSLKKALPKCTIER